MKKHMFKKIYETLVKKTRVYSIWTKTFLPPHVLAEQGRDSTPDSCPWEHRAPGRRAFFRGGGRLQHLGSCPKLLDADAESRLNAAKRWGLPSSSQAPLVGCSMLRILMPSSLVPGSWDGGSMAGEASWKDLRPLASPPYPNHIHIHTHWALRS